MNDHLVRIISDEANVRALACITTGLADEARRLHDTSPTVSAALGRALSAGALMGALLKRGQRVGLKFEGTGPMKKIIVEADGRGTIRGCVGVPRVEEPPAQEKIAVSRALGTEGFLTVIRDEGLRQPYQGIVALRTGEIAEDLAWYFTESEQIPSAVGLGVFIDPAGAVTAAGGFLVQAMPPADESNVDRLTETINSMPPVTSLIREGATAEDMLAMIFKDIPYRVLEKRGLSLSCPCSRERIEQVLISLGHAELDRMLHEEGSASVTCEFCRTRYSFGPGDLKELLSEVNGAPGESP